MPLLSYIVVVGSVLLGLLFLAEGQLGPGVPPRPETNPLHEQMAQRAERAKERLSQNRSPGVSVATARVASEAQMAQASAPEMSAASRPAAAPAAAEKPQKPQKPQKVATAPKKKKTKLARDPHARDPYAREQEQRFARYQTLGPPRQYQIGYQ